MSDLLSGIRVLESAALYNGDTVGMLLGDLGADVIKIESPFRGDYLRDFLGQVTPHHSPAHLQVNKNKRSVTLDLRQDEGREIFWKLFETADVFVDGNAADACAKLGIGYEAQRARNPAIVYCQYTGFGSEGPYHSIPTHGQMMNVIVAATPTEMGDDGFLHEVPGPGLLGNMRSGGEGTAAGAIHAAFHVAAALVQRERTGAGCFIDVAGHDGVVVNGWIAATYLLNAHRITDPVGMPARADGQSTGAKYQFYETRDGSVVLFCAIEPKFWVNFCRAVGREDLVGDVGSPVPVDFAADETDLRRELQAIFHTRASPTGCNSRSTTTYRSARRTARSRRPSTIRTCRAATCSCPVSTRRPDRSPTSARPRRSPARAIASGTPPRDSVNTRASCCTRSASTTQRPSAWSRRA